MIFQGTNTKLKGILHLVDLAGSERLERSGAGADKALLRETVNINKSLSSLADVFTALGNKQSHIPFRNSKLTFLMQDCLSGSGKALMFVNLSPTALSAPETLCSLRYAGCCAALVDPCLIRICSTEPLPPPHLGLQICFSSQSGGAREGKQANVNQFIWRIKERHCQQERHILISSSHAKVIKVHSTVYSHLLFQ
jgi:hypothetical protein